MAFVSGTTSYIHITRVAGCDSRGGHTNIMDAPKNQTGLLGLFVLFGREYIPSATSTSRLCGTLGFFQWTKVGLYVGVRSRYGSAVVVVVKFEDQVRSALLINSSYTVQAKAELIAFLLMRSATPSISDRTPSSEIILWQA